MMIPQGAQVRSAYDEYAKSQPQRVDDPLRSPPSPQSCFVCFVSVPRLRGKTPKDSFCRNSSKENLLFQVLFCFFCCVVCVCVWLALPRFQRFLVSL